MFKCPKYPLFPNPIFTSPHGPTFIKKKVLTARRLPLLRDRARIARLLATGDRLRQLRSRRREDGLAAWMEEGGQSVRSAPPTA